MRLEGKRAIVTGGNRGIGRAIALRLADEGADVAVCASKSVDSAEAVAQEIRAKGRNSVATRGDVSNADEVEALVSDVLEKFSSVDILVNNAGINRDGLLMRMKEEDWDAVLDVNLKGAFLCTKAISRSMMKARSGRIINVSSVVGLMGNAGQVNYSASKAGLLGLTKSAAKELAARGITVNAVCPGFIPTEMTDGMPEKSKEALIGLIPLGRLGSTEDIAATVAFLSSEDAKYITGQAIVVDGGMVM
ncbi:MAG: 3-oxoacyl-[acyl-carrier-protein] reductase [Candidatus Latescibacterota bacterium]|nr:3-oxoacyl-[acyl-carrier-protein] reductase [Candidatus Latescibacterota bacterium]